MPTPTSQTTPDQKKPEGAELKPAADKPIQVGSATAKFLKELTGDAPKLAGLAAREEAAAGEEVEKPAPKPAPKKKAAPPATVSAIDEEKLGASIGRSIAEHTAKASGGAEAKQADQKKPEPTRDEEKEARRIAVLERMEKLHGKTYEGIAGRYRESKAKLREYAAEWEKANPGEKFDADAAEHEAVIQDLEDKFDYEEDDYLDALADIRVEKKVAETALPRESQLEERLSRIEREEVLKHKQHEINAVAYAAGDACLQKLGDEFAAAIKKDGGLDESVLKELAAADPVKHDIGIAAMKAAEQGVAVIHMLAGGLDVHDPKNPAHTALSQFARSQEQALLQRSPEDRADDKGRQFCSRDEYQAMTPAERKCHWVFSPDDLKALWVHDVARRAKSDLAMEDEKFSRRARARGLITGDEKDPRGADEASASRRARGSDSSDADESESSGKPVSPTFASSPKLAVAKGGAGAGSKTGVERFLGDLLGR